MATSRERFSQDAIVGYVHDLGFDAERLGGRVEFPERGIPRVATPPLAEDATLGAGLAGAEATLDDLPPGRWPAVLQTVARVKQLIGDQAALAANVEGPVTRAGVLRGLDKLALDMAADRETARRIVELSVELAVRSARDLLRAGCDFLFIAAATDGPAVISPQDYLEFSIPGLRRLVAVANEAGCPTIFHPHGRFTDPRFHPLVEAAIDCGIAGFQFGEQCDLGVARETWRDRVCILGGPDVPEVLVPGPAEQVAEVTRRILQEAMDDGGFIIMASCSVHRGAPVAHLEAMVETVLAEGLYD
jgi:MtaA/CmuA family methyltransferase